MADTSFAHLTITEHDPHIVEVMIDRPDALNALNLEVLDELETMAQEIAGRPKLGAVILSGAGRAFVAGADIKAMLEMSPEAAEAFSHKGHATMQAIANIPVPVLAAINGYALGGGLELALACDLLYASTKAKLGLPEVGLGLIPGFGGTQRLGRLIGYHAAREMIFTGSMVDAERALKLGLVLSVHDPDDLMEHVREVATTIASRGPRAIRAAKRVIKQGRDETLADGLSKEAHVFEHLFHHDEPREGMRAHLEKRDPDFE